MSNINLNNLIAKRILHIQNCNEFNNIEEHRYDINDIVEWVKKVYK